MSKTFKRFQLAFLFFSLCSFLPSSVICSRVVRIDSEKAIIKVYDVPFHYVTYDKKTGSFSVIKGYRADGSVGPAALGNYTAPLNHSSNIGQLWINTSSLYPDIIQAQAAGYLEGYITAETIFNHFVNVNAYYPRVYGNTFDIGMWLISNDQWVRSQIRLANAGNFSAAVNNFWGGVELVLSHFDGLVAGYTAYVSDLGPTSKLQLLTKMDFLMLNSLGDLQEISQMLFPEHINDGWDNFAPGALRSAVAKSGRCSALVKVTPDLSDLLIGHATWWTYSSMLRIFKHFNYQFSGNFNKRVSMSGYPGLISSMDDWYILGSGLVITGTSNDIHNASLLSLITKTSALSWHRVLAANFLATSGPEWASWAATYNSGTNPGQYMAVDLKRFVPGQQLSPGLLTILELLPGLNISDDATDELVTGYWPSYNVPYFPQTYALIGNKEILKKQVLRGAEYAAAVSGLSYQLAPRAKIFRRDAVKVVDLASMKTLIRSNGYPTDDFSSTSPWDAICARGDLDPENPDAYGCYDGKVTSYKLALKLASEAVSAPPVVDGVVFSWATSPFSALTTHRGQPQSFEGATWLLQAP